MRKKQAKHQRRERSRPSLVDTIISVITVTHNDEDIVEDRLRVINKTLRRLGTNYEILVVDNNSQDGTVAKIKELVAKIPYIRALVLSKKYDTEIVLTAGLDNCVGDFAKLFNIYTDPPEMLPLMLDKLLEGHDIVIGKAKHPPIQRDAISRLFLSFITKMSRGFHHPDSYLIALNRKAINSIIRTRRKSRNFGYIHSLIGFKRCIIEYKAIRKFRHKLPRENFIDLFLSTMDTMISNSFKPIRILSFLGMFASVAFLLYVAGVVILVFGFGMSWIAPKGWITIATILGTMFLILFSILAVMSEYVIRIVHESRNEPFYFVSEEIDKSVVLPKRSRRLNVV